MSNKGFLSFSTSMSMFIIKQSPQATSRSLKLTKKKKLGEELGKVMLPAATIYSVMFKLFTL